jgi:hypothetical protein
MDGFQTDAQSVPCGHRRGSVEDLGEHLQPQIGSNNAKSLNGNRQNSMLCNVALVYGHVDLTRFNSLPYLFLVLTPLHTQPIRHKPKEITSMAPIMWMIRLGISSRVKNQR